MDRSRLSPGTVAALVGAAGFVFPYLTSGAIENDHFVMLARAHEVLYGDWPIRDFVDPGQPLAYLVSTGAAAIFGPTLLVNIVLCILLLSATAALTYLLALRATGSTIAGLAAAAITIAIYPRMYNTTKIIVPVVAIWLAWRYADAPSSKRLTAMAAWTAIAFLLRHDYLLYVAISNAVLLAGLPNAQADRARRIGTYAGLSALFVAPWLLYIQAYEGLPEYVASALRFVAAEQRRTVGGPPSALFYLVVAIPVVGLVLSIRSRYVASDSAGPNSAASDRLRLTAAQLASASVLVLVMDVVFLRDVLAARLPDVVAAMSVVAAAIAGQLWSRRAIDRAAIAALCVALGVGVVLVATRSHGRLSPMDVLRQPVRVTRRLEAASPEIQPNPTLAPLISYLEQCTRDDDRVLVGGFGPEIPVLAHRRFAAGLPEWIPGYYEDAADVSRAVATLNRERLGAVVLLDGSNVFMRSWPALGEWVRAHDFQEHDVPSINPRIRVWLPRAAAAMPAESFTGLPCVSR